MKKIIALMLIVSSCTWENDGKIVKDSEGNLYQLKANGVRNESYDVVKVLSKQEIDSLLKQRQ